MLVDERAASFVRSLIQDDTPELELVGAEALRDHVPIIRPETKELLKVLLLQKKPVKVLEVGTAVGYSAIYMSQYLPEGGHLTTIEKYEPRVVKARENIAHCQVEDKITLLEGDAAEILKKLDDAYDFIFMDAAKGQYMSFLDDVIRLLAPDGILVSDNVLQDGEILESHFTVPKRNRTIHDRMRAYLRTIKNHELLETAVLTVGDGLAISTKLS